MVGSAFVLTVAAAIVAYLASLAATSLAATSLATTLPVAAAVAASRAGWMTLGCQRGLQQALAAALVVAWAERVLTLVALVASGDLVLRWLAQCKYELARASFVLLTHLV